MAGGKETPRQKLIGIMYLILLALLALQVSSSIMEKFYAQEISLLDAAQETITRNDGQMKAIEKSVAERNTEEEQRKLKLANEARQETAAVIAYLKDLKDKLVKATDGLDEDGFYKGAKSETEIEEYMLNNGQKRAKEFRAKVDSYRDNIIRIAKEVNPKRDWDKEIARLALDGKDDKIAKKNPDSKRKNFGELNFAQTPLVAVLAMLAERQAKVATYEQLVLGEISGKKTTIEFDEVFADFKAKSEYVPAGLEYEAKIFLGGRNKNLKPDITFGGSKIAVDAEGFGIVKFKASGGTYDKEGRVKKTWTANVTFTHPSKGPVTQPIEGTYFVTKPDVIPISGALNQLYEKCGNPLTIICPALGAEYSPSFSLVNAAKVAGDGPTKLYVVPNKAGQEVTISVSNKGGAKLGDLKFAVKPVPLPRLEAKSGGVLVNPKVGIKSSSSSVVITPIADDNFASTNPQDAQYTITQMDVQVGRGTRLRINKTVNSGIVKLNEFSVQPGERIVVEIKKMTRKNFQGESIEVKLPPAVSTTLIPISD